MAMLLHQKRFYNIGHWSHARRSHWSNSQDCGRIGPFYTCGLEYKSFTIIIYDHNDNGLHYNTIISANLDLARSINYDRKVCLQTVACTIKLLGS